MLLSLILCQLHILLNHFFCDLGDRLVIVFRLGQRQLFMVQALKRFDCLVEIGFETLTGHKGIEQQVDLSQFGVEFEHPKRVEGGELVMAEIQILQLLEGS